MLRKEQLVEGEYYHVYNRGTDKRIIFHSDHDYRRFVLLLYLANNKEPVNISTELEKGRSFSDLMSLERKGTFVGIGAYCLMPNHFHILLTQKEEKGITEFMKKVGTGYSMYFNKKYDRSGSLFCKPFKASHADSDNYLKYLFAYIHLNPVKLIDKGWKENGIKDRRKAEEFLKRYLYSSYLDYMGRQRPEKVIVSKEEFPEYFSNSVDFKSYINDWLSYHM